jgi:peptide/nickel transport system substrate-binding protein
MLIGMDPSDDEGFAREWVEHLVRFNEILPEIALYNTESYSIFNNKIKGYDENPHYTFAFAIAESYVG